MKKLFIAMIALAMVGGFYGYLYADGSGAGLRYSPHDFSADAWNQRQGEMCRTCHVPHDHGRTLAIQAGIETSGLLWNHLLSSVTYTLYSSPTLTGAIGQPTGTAKMCLGCHDGTVALEAMDSKSDGSHVPTTYIQDVNAGYRVPGTAMGSSLQGTHPISVTYDVADTGLKPTSDLMGGSGTIASLLDGGDGGKVQCATCHDVHDASGESIAGTHLLRVKTSDAANPSGLCVVCHNK